MSARQTARLHTDGDPLSRIAILALMTRMLTFVTPRYGAEVYGGAEQGARSLAIRLASEGWNVKVISSCAISHTTWSDAYEPGICMEEGVEVLRCSVDRQRPLTFDDFSTSIFRHPKLVNKNEALKWIDSQGPDSHAILDAIESVSKGVLVFYPYLYQPTVRGIHLAQVPTILHPACHQEPAIQLSVFDTVFNSPNALAFHSRSEQKLVWENFTDTKNIRQAVIGLPVEIDGHVDADLARSSLGLGDEPFFLYLGRIDAGKGVHELISLFSQFRNRYDKGRLVLAGPVVDTPPDTAATTILGPIPAQHKFGLLAAADVLINPSYNESFSTVVVEAMLVGTPVLVNGHCRPLREHCENSCAGLWYTGIADFQTALNRLTGDSALRDAIAARSRGYAENCFSWPSVRMRYERLLHRFV